MKSMKLGSMNSMLGKRGACKVEKPSIKPTTKSGKVKK